MESYIGRTLGDFRILRELGRGGQGFVFLARQESLKRDVALKIIPVPVSVSSNQVKRFTREAEATARLKHHNIIEIYQVAQEVGHYFYAMELVDGWSLDKIIAGMKNHVLTGQDTTAGTGSSGEPITRGEDDLHLKELDIVLPISDSGEMERDGAEANDAGDLQGEVEHFADPQEEGRLEAGRYDLLPSNYYRWTAKLIQQAADALDHAHKNGVIHRDIKPANLLVNKEAVVKITDFGLARNVGEETITVSGRHIGTPAYMSPEQIRIRAAKVDKRTDIYSLGVTLYEAISLERPFKGETEQGLYNNIRVKEPEDPSRINPNTPRDLAVIALKAVEKEPDRRYQSAQEMADDLNRYLSNLPILAKPPTLIDKTVKFAKRNKVQVSIGSLAAAVLVVVLSVVLAVQTSEKRAKISALLHEARQAKAEKRYEEALNSYQRILGINPNHIEAVRQSSRLALFRAEDEVKRRRRQAQELVKEGEALIAHHSELKDSTAELEEELKDMSKKIRGQEPVEEKAPLWEVEDALKETQRDVAETFGDVVSKLTEALGLDPENQRAKSDLAELYWHKFSEAEAEQNEDDMIYFRRLVETYDIEEKYAQRLKGDGAIQITSDPTGAEVYLYEYVEKDRVLTPSNERKLGVTPISKQPLAMGSYLLILKAEGYRDVRYPVLIERQEDESADVKMYTDEEIGKDFIYVPAGEFIMGGDEKSYDPVERHKEYVEGFFIAKFEVTCGEYAQFLNSLAEHNPGEAAKYVPRCNHFFRKGGTYFCRGRSTLPVHRVTWHCANAYVAWKSTKDRLEYRLTTDAAWEKAARGVDRRIYPWGNQFDPTFCKMLLVRKKAAIEAIGTYEKDESPYGVRDMAGSMVEWCDDVRANTHPIRRAIRGGSWGHHEICCRIASRFSQEPARFDGNIGFRVARSTPPPDP